MCSLKINGVPAQLPYPEVAPVIQPPRKVPVEFKDRVKSELKKMEDLGDLITKHLNLQVNSMVTVVKSKELIICIDTQHLQKAVQRNHYPLCILKETVAEIPKCFQCFMPTMASGKYNLMKRVSAHLCSNL